jgi:hypothetical protein
MGKAVAAPAPADDRPPSSVSKLRTVLLRVFHALMAGEMKEHNVKEINNAAGKAIATVKLQLEYAALRKEKPNIPFLDDDE